MSLPTASVPRKWPSESAGWLASRMLPPVGAGTVPKSGHTKHKKKIRISTPAGIAIPSERAQPCRGETVGAPAAGIGMLGATGASGSYALITDSRIQHRVQQVGDQVREH